MSGLKAGVGVRVLLASAGLAMVVGCGRGEIFPTIVVPPPVVHDGGCSLTVAPPALDFGNVGPGSGTEWVELRNVSKQLCEISEIALGAGTDPRFSLTSGQPQSLDIRAGEGAGIAVVFASGSPAPPTHHTGSLGIATSDPDHPVFKIPLSADVTP